MHNIGKKLLENLLNFPKFHEENSGYSNMKHKILHQYFARSLFQGVETLRFVLEKFMHFQSF
jgi:hypothetical protein